MKLKALLVAAAVSVLGQFASAQEVTHISEGGPLWVCNVKFQGQARGFQVVIGKFEVNGKGDLDCYAPTGDRMQLPIKIKMYSGPVAARIAFGSYDVYGASADFALFSKSPYDLLGKYYVAQAQGTVVAGAGVITGVHADHSNISLTFNLQFLKGLGLNFGLTTMKLALDNTRL